MALNEDDARTLARAMIEEQRSAAKRGVVGGLCRFVALCVLAVICAAAFVLLGLRVSM